MPVVRWVLVEEGGRLPEGAIQIGQEKDGKPLCVFSLSSHLRRRRTTALTWRRPFAVADSYAARAFHDGCASIGKTWADEKRA